MEKFTISCKLTKYEVELILRYRKERNNFGTFVKMFLRKIDLNYFKSDEFLEFYNANLSKPQESLNETMSIQFDEELMEKINRLCEMKGWKTSQAIRVLIVTTCLKNEHLKEEMSSKMLKNRIKVNLTLNEYNEIGSYLDKNVDMDYSRLSRYALSLLIKVGTSGIDMIKFQDKPTKSFTILLNEEQLNQVDKLTTKYKLSRSSLIRVLVLSYINKKNGVITSEMKVNDW